MNISFENRVALVTGAGSGLGLATAQAFAAAGASVALADWNEKAVRSAVDTLASNGHKVLAIRCNVSDDADVEAMVCETIAKFGRLDVAYNNAKMRSGLSHRAGLQALVFGWQALRASAASDVETAADRAARSAEAMKNSCDGTTSGAMNREKGAAQSQIGACLRPPYLRCRTPQCRSFHNYCLFAVSPIGGRQNIPRPMTLQPSNA